jgi:hypothetical protein
VLGGDALPAVQGLVGQSLLTVSETRAGVRYRMLETVREFGRMQLVDAGEDREARAALRRWAVGYASDHGARLNGPGQYAAIDALGDEEINLADELRDSLADDDHGTLVQLLSALAMFWTMRGEHVRLLVLADAVADAICDWQPPPQLREATSAATALMLSNIIMGGSQRFGQLQALLRRLGTDVGAHPQVSGLARVMLVCDPGDQNVFVRGLEQLADDPDCDTAVAACHWLSNMRENAGDLVGATEAAQRALALAGDGYGPWLVAMPRAMLAQLRMHAGDRVAAVEHAQAALPVLQRLGAGDDEIQLRSLLAFCAIVEGRLADARAELDRMDRISESWTGFGGSIFRDICRAELLLARGDHAAGLALYRECMARMQELTLPGVTKTGLEPWVLLGASVALAAHAYHATAADEEHGDALLCACRGYALRVLGAADADLDYPVAGLLLFALGVWGLLRRAAPADDAIRLLVLADRFAYNRTIPTVMWERIGPSAEETAPGRIAEFQVTYAHCRPADLLVVACGAVGQLPG